MDAEVVDDLDEGAELDEDLPDADVDDEVDEPRTHDEPEDAASRGRRRDQSPRKTRSQSPRKTRSLLRVVERRGLPPRRAASGPRQDEARVVLGRRPRQGGSSSGSTSGRGRLVARREGELRQGVVCELLRGRKAQSGSSRRSRAAAVRAVRFASAGSIKKELVLSASIGNHRRRETSCQ